VDIDIAALADQLMPYLTAAIGGYGAAVAAKTQDVVADETVSLGRRLVQRLLTWERSQPQMQAAISDVARAPEDEDAAAALRLLVKRRWRPTRPWPPNWPGCCRRRSAGGITAVGGRAAAVAVNTGVIRFGDDSTAQR
jgi:hypothetical protein